MCFAEAFEAAQRANEAVMEAMRQPNASFQAMKCNEMQ